MAEKSILTAHSFIRNVLILSLVLCSGVASTDTHTVKKGDTLWDISNMYLRDPFKWPDIWHLNPEIKNPHLIFPGDNIRLDLGEDVSVTPADLSDQPPPEPSKRELPKPAGPRYLLPQIIARAPFLAVPVKSGQIFNNEGKVQFKSSSGETILQPYSKITILMGKKDGVKAGAFYQIYESGKKYSDFQKKGRLGTLITIKGIIKIQIVRDEDSDGILVQCFGAISEKARVSPWEKADVPGILGYDKYPDMERGGQVIHLQDNQNQVLPYSYVIIDNGSSAGIKIGDGVILFNRDPVKKQADDTVLGKGIVVRINDFSTSILVKEIYSGKLNKGDFAIAIHSANIREG